MIRPFAPEDYGPACALWAATEGVGLGPGDAEADVQAFLRRNAGLSLVAVDTVADALVAAVLCGHDGRRGYIYHLAVAPAHRRRGLGRAIVAACLTGLEAAGIRRGQVSVFATNELARAFWGSVGGQLRSDLAVFSIPLRGDDR